VRLEGWKPAGDCLEVNFDTPLPWVIDCINRRASKDLIVKFMCHGLPGFLQFANGSTLHPQAGNGVTVHDLPFFEKIRGSLKRLEFHSCLVARIGSCPECDGMEGYDGNYFCYRMAQTIGAQVKASIHIQWYNDGTYKGGAPTGDGVNFGKWNGRVFTWSKKGKIIRTQDFPYHDG
jgi:hypothetical protein